MKNRQGFVSNSSSSSYIIGVGKIKNLDNFKKWMNKNKINSETCFGILVKSTSDILKSPGYGLYSLRNNNLVVEGCVNHSPEVTIPINPAEEELYCVVNIGNDEGDDPFRDGYDLNYSIVADYFEGVQASILKMLQSNNLLETCSWDYGAARNG